MLLNAKGEEVTPASATIPDSRLWFFHVVMAAGALYMAMLLTNWGTGSFQPQSNVTAPSPSGGKSVVKFHSNSTGTAQMWVKIVSEWLAIILYTWTLVAPRVCPGREFA